MLIVIVGAQAIDRLLPLEMLVIVIRSSPSSNSQIHS